MIGIALSVGRRCSVCKRSRCGAMNGVGGLAEKAEMQKLGRRPGDVASLN